MPTVAMSMTSEALQDGKASPFGDDEKRQRQCGRIDAAGVKRRKSRIRSSHIDEGVIARFEARAPDQMTRDEIVSSADGNRDGFASQIGD